MCNRFFNSRQQPRTHCWFLSDSRPLMYPGHGKRPDRERGRHEVIHCLVCDGTASWVSESNAHEIHETIFPPVQIQNTTSGQIAAALVHLLETHLFGVRIHAFLRLLAVSFSSLHFHMVADSAAANLRLVAKILQFLSTEGKTCNLSVTASFFPCSLHQVARLVIMNLERQKVSAALYSISRLYQSTPLRQKTLASLIEVLRARFDYQVGFPPRDETATPEFRSDLLRMLTNNWSSDSDSARVSNGIDDHIIALLRFFNGNLTDAEKWSHYCSGPECCPNKRASLNKAKPFPRIEPSSRTRSYFWMFGTPFYQNQHS